MLRPLSGRLHTYSTQYGALTAFESGNVSATSCVLFIAGLTEVCSRSLRLVIMHDVNDRGIQRYPVYSSALLSARGSEMESRSIADAQQLFRLWYWKSAEGF